MTSENIKEKEMDDLEPHLMLANAIVLQACKDYRRAYKIHVRTYRPGVKPDDKLEELERFFRSEWYRTLTSVDGEYLMKRIKMEVLSYEKRR